MKCLIQNNSSIDDILNKKESKNKIYMNMSLEESDVLKEVCNNEDDVMKMMIETEEKE